MLEKDETDSQTDTTHTGLLLYAFHYECSQCKKYGSTLAHAYGQQLVTIRNSGKIIKKYKST